MAHQQKMPPAAPSGIRKDALRVALQSEHFEITRLGRAAQGAEAAVVARELFDTLACARMNGKNHRQGQSRETFQNAIKARQIDGVLSPMDGGQEVALGRETKARDDLRSGLRPKRRKQSYIRSPVQTTRAASPSRAKLATAVWVGAQRNQRGDRSRYD